MNKASIIRNFAAPYDGCNYVVQGYAMCVLATSLGLRYSRSAGKLDKNNMPVHGFTKYDFTTISGRLLRSITLTNT